MKEDVSTWCSSAKREYKRSCFLIFTRISIVSLIHITRKSLEQQRSRILRKLISRFALEHRYYENLEQMSFARALFERSRSDKSRDGFGGSFEFCALQRGGGGGE